MIDPIFDHDRVDVYCFSIEYTAEAFVTAEDLSGLHRLARDQWLRAAQSIPLNIAEGNVNRSLQDRARFFDIARGSSFECAAIQDVLVATGGLDCSVSGGLKTKLKRIVSMLTRMAMKFENVSESSTEYAVAIDYEHEHRDAEHEHERKPEPGRAPEDGLRGFTNGKSIVRRQVTATVLLTSSIVNRFTLLFLLCLACITGCSDPVRPHLEDLLREYARVVGTQFPKLDLYEGDERKVRYLHAHSTATHEMLKNYLSVDRPITVELKQFLIDWQTVSKRSMDLHGKMIQDGRYTYNDDEKEIAERLTKGEALAGFELMDHFEGY